MNNIYDTAEQIVFELRKIYHSFGYQAYKMGKFEEYDLYSKNKDFLISDSVITFTDIGGKLMALKPDVTLSIIKNNRGLSGRTKKLYYNENVYRVSKGTNSFKEIMQSGVECLGDIDSYAVGENLYLAALSLEKISPDFALCVSDLDILSEFLSKLTDDSAVITDILKCVSEKNTHSILDICRDNDIAEQDAQALISLVKISGPVEESLDEIEKLLPDEAAKNAFEKLKAVLSVFSGDPLINNVKIDFSVVSDFSYYNGVVFKGFVEGVPAAVLSGGQYDKLMKKMHRRSKAVGFAVYLDMLSRLSESPSGYDVDAALVYKDGDDPNAVIRELNSLRAQGKSVIAVKDNSPELRCKEIVRFSSKEASDS